VTAGVAVLFVESGGGEGSDRMWSSATAELFIRVGERMGRRVDCYCVEE